MKRLAEKVRTKSYLSHRLHEPHQLMSILRLLQGSTCRRDTVAGTPNIGSQRFAVDDGLSGSYFGSEVRFQEAATGAAIFTWTYFRAKRKLGRYWQREAMLQKRTWQNDLP
jgi:hypothetical protein